MKRSLLMLLLLSGPANANWYKGQLHAHTTNSFDGTVSPAAAISMYRAAGYDFVGLSDHNFVTPAQQYTTPTFLAMQNDELSLGSGAVVIPGEVTGPLHVNAINLNGGHPSAVPPRFRA
jgi:hypothetical protein